MSCIIFFSYGFMKINAISIRLAEMQFTFFLFFGYVGVSLLSPVMHNLWIWRVSLSLSAC
jgi:hypothetical protein